MLQLNPPPRDLLSSLMTNADMWASRNNLAKNISCKLQFPNAHIIGTVGLTVEQDRCA